VRKRRREAGRYLYRENRVRNIDEFERERERERQGERWREKGKNGDGEKERWRMREEVREREFLVCERDIIGEIGIPRR